jgi:hypothetical protein
MSADREPPFVRLPESRIIPFDVRSEQTFDVHWELYVNTHRVCHPVGLVKRSIIDSAGKVTSFEDVPSIADPKNLRTKLDRQLKLPMGITTGPARYHAETCFACNPVQKLWPICITQPDIPFNVLPRL